MDALYSICSIEKIHNYYLFFLSISFGFPQPVSLLALSKSTRYKVHFAPRRLIFGQYFCSKS